MPSRMNNRGKQSGRRRIVIILEVMVPIVLIAGGLAYAYSGSEHKPTQSQSLSSQKAKTTAKQTSKTNKSSVNSRPSTSSSSQETTAPDLTGIGFQIMPVLFNGEDVNTAMNENKAPQNTVHDGAQLGYFSSRTQARVSGIAGYMYAHTVSYGIDGDTLAFNGWNIPLNVVNGEIQPVQFDAKDYEGNMITWKIEPLSDAQATVEAHQSPDENSASADSQVDPHNLTAAQMEHWVRSYLEASDSEYHANDYSFTQKFVEGYAEIYAFKNGESSPEMAYRVDENGHLQAAHPHTEGGWQTVSTKYF